MAWNLCAAPAPLGLEQKLIASRAPWQNPFVERLIGSNRRECLDHVIVFNARHLHQLLADDVNYHHRHRPHRSLEQDCPEPRAKGGVRGRYCGLVRNLFKRP